VIARPDEAFHKEMMTHEKKGWEAGSVYGNRDCGSENTHWTRACACQRHLTPQQCSLEQDRSLPARWRHSLQDGRVIAPREDPSALDVPPEKVTIFPAAPKRGIEPGAVGLEQFGPQHRIPGSSLCPGDNMPILVCRSIEKAAL